MDGAGATASTLELLKKGFAKALDRPGVDKLDALEVSFIEQAVEDYVADETPELGPDDLAHVLAGFWRLGETRDAAGPVIRLAPGTGAKGEPVGYDILEIIQADAPFLVDSVMGELGDQGVSVRAMFHPVLSLERDGKGRRKAGSAIRESTILVVLDPVPADRRERIIEGVRQTLDDVHLAVADFPEMIELMESAIQELQRGVPGKSREELDEDIAFLKWLHADHFVFLGARIYDFPRTFDGAYESDAPLPQPEHALGVLRDPERPVLRRASEPALLTKQMRSQLDLGAPVTVAKSNLSSRVHRRARMDYIGVRRFRADGKPAGEIRFVGLFTAEAYDRAASEVPLVRRKVSNVLRRAGKMPGSHNEKRLRNIVENYPRDELFQTTDDDLLRIALGILHLYDRPRVRLFARNDPFDRFISVLLFVPRERYDPSVRERAGRILADAWGGRISAFYPLLSDTPLVRVHFIIGVTPGDHPEPDIAKVEAAIADASRTWSDRFLQAARESGVADAELSSLASTWAEAFPVAFRDRYGIDEALTDLREIGASSEDEIRVRAFRRPEDSIFQFHFKLYRRGLPVALADVMPILENMGLKALEEYAYPVAPSDGATAWVHEFVMEDPRGERLFFKDIKAPFEEGFAAVWAGRTESDGFNRLLMELSIDWREAALVRALARYRQQTGLDPSQAVQVEAVRDHPEVTRLILELFKAKFDPSGPKDREGAAEAIFTRITEALQAVVSLDHDRVLRRLALLVQAVKRTNYYQAGADGQAKPYISFKVASRELADLPEPKPYREIFVWAPHVEGVHLRFGPVARGGLRWSDRRDDFRTEVLGLVKAQQVKNAVIVPVGSKGGFYPKSLPKGGAPDEVRAEGVRAYRTFLQGLLDLTDNLDAQGSVVRPNAVVAWDQDDPYLVVAADKGTATFSDIANGVSADYGFWLGDAFASGGSQGYDHKAMGITAKGAWEAVKRHFRELGKDIQSEPFTVMGVGDMSGDVFGNGMLLSKAIKLVAAFDHRDIFLDPNPDPATSFAERKRMFALPRSSWQDYDKAKISKGGGVFSRALKSVPLSPEIKAALEVTEDALPPADLMRAILKAPCELLYFGGIGTYLKARTETDQQVGDKANDAIRVTADELRAKVIGEGANLGVTQAGRIAFARLGGRINTDAIDNSAGVDTSDHEVNIKILTGALEAQGKLDREGRNALLAEMTDEVGAHVLGHNYDQTLALSLQQATAAADLDAHARFMVALEGRGKLNRQVEGLPGRTAMAELAAAGQGLTRPELAVLTAYGKLELSEDIEATSAPDDPFFEETLVRYFPTELTKYEDAMRGHRLRREIISTVLANDIVNMAGPTFSDRLRAAAECDVGAMVTAFEAARRVFRLDEAWDAVSALDLKAPAEAQARLYEEIATVLRRQTFWLARRAARNTPSVLGLIEAYRPAADGLREAGTSILSEFEKAAVTQRAELFIAAGAPQGLSRTVAGLRSLGSTTDLADMARQVGWPVENAARLYHQVGASLGFDRLRGAAGALVSGDHYERMATRRLIEDLLAEQAQLALSVARASDAEAGAAAKAAQAAIKAWAGERAQALEQARRTVDEIEQAGAGWSFAKLTIANAALRELAATVLDKP